ncbi:hypothetical protein [Herbidospora mongoliensis]|uniref:hypothetical protein n=1 Tax=Herbidospora mongoliensis TaxID=688067 RepID=UPI00082A0A01|nr:hypothetical protein [Herbidospora mongoliensis]
MTIRLLSTTWATVDRARQLTGEVLLCLFLVLMGTGIYSMTQPIPAFAPDGSLSSIYSMVSYYNARDGLLSRVLHGDVSTMLLAVAVVWALLGRYGLGPVVFALGLLMTLVGNTWVHLVAALVIAVILVRCSWQEARVNRRTWGFVAATLGLTAFLVVVI